MNIFLVFIFATNMAIAMVDGRKVLTQLLEENDKISPGGIPNTESPLMKDWLTSYEGKNASVQQFPKGLVAICTIKLGQDKTEVFEWFVSFSGTTVVTEPKTLQFSPYPEPESAEIIQTRDNLTKLAVETFFNDHIKKTSEHRALSKLTDIKFKDALLASKLVTVYQNGDQSNVVANAFVVGIFLETD